MKGEYNDPNYQKFCVLNIVVLVLFVRPFYIMKCIDF